MRHLLFFATKEDLLPVLDAVERHGPLKYIRTDMYSTPTYKIVASGAEIPNLGTATFESSICCDTYLITDLAAPVQVRCIMTIAGEELFSIDQLFNPDSVVLTPAGIWSSEILLHGRVATVSDSADAQRLMRRFKSAINKHFTKVNAFWVGPQALECFETGVRLTAAVQSPPEFALSR